MMIDVDEAHRVLFSHVKPLDSVCLPLYEAGLRTLAAPIVCDLDYPPFDRSVMDGYAVRSSDVVDVPARLRVVGQIAAGRSSGRAVGAGEAMQINTGAPIPPGADAVVRVERTESSESSDEVLVHEAVSSGSFITRRAAYVSKGDVVLVAGTRLTSLAIGAVAAAGAASVETYRCPNVAVLATGDELVEVGEKPTGAQIRNSNSYLLMSLIRSAQAVPIVLGPASDDRGVLRERIMEGLDADVLCITGGVSMGAFDFVPEVLEECGVTFHIRKMAIKPGRPTIFGTTRDGTLVFALPGNPASALIGFELLVRPALAALEGRSGVVPDLLGATLSGTLGSTGDRRTYVPASARVCGDGGWSVEPLSWQGSGDSFGMASAGALIVRPPNAESVGAGERVSIMMLERH